MIAAPPSVSCVAPPYVASLVTHLVPVLAGSLSADFQSRDTNEKQLEELQKLPGFGVALCNILINQTQLLEIRQLSGLLLKRYIRHHWSPSVTRDECRLRIPDTDRDIIKLILPQALHFSEFKLRMAASMCIASIAHWDWPKSWPNLIQNLLDCLGSNNNNLIEGAICCLETIASGENSSDEQLPALIDLLFPRLLHIVSESTNQFDDRIKMRAVSVVTSCLEWLSVTKQVSPSTTNLVSSVIPQWIETFYRHLSTRHLTNQFFGLKTTILGTLLVLIHHFPGQIKNEMDKILMPIWMGLVELLGAYELKAVRSDTLRDVEGLREGETGEFYGLGPFVSLALEVFHSMASKSRFRKLLKSHLSQLFYLAIGYMQMTEEQIEMYNSDPNQWVADEDDDTLEFNVRISSGKLVQELVHGFKQEAHQPFTEAITKRIQESADLLKNNDKFWWKLREVVIYSVGLVADDLIETSGFDFKGFCKSILIVDINSQLPFLRGRSLWCASRIGKVLSVEEIEPFLSVASNILNSTDPIPSKIFACRAIANFCPRLHSNTVGTYIDGIMGGLVSIIEILSKETLYLLLETLHVLLPLSEEVSLKYLNSICKALLVLWAHNYKDGVLMSCMLDIFSDFAQFSSCNPILQEKIVTTLVNLLGSSQKHQLIVMETTIDIASAVIMPAKGVVCSGFMDQFFPILCNLMMTTQEGGILDSGTTALRAFVRNAGPLLLNWKHPQFNESGLEIIIKIVSKLLSPGIPDNSAMGAGFLIDKIITTFPQQIGPILDVLLTTVLERLHQSHDSSLHQGLLMVFIRLFYMDPEQSINFLLGKGGGAISELVFVLGEWTRQHSDFRGAFKIKLSIMAMCKLFQCSNPILNPLTVPGDMEITSSGTKTRSKSKPKFIEEPIRFIIFKILLREYQVIVEDFAQGDISLSDSGEALDWDEEDDNDLGTISQLPETEGTHLKSSPFADQSLFSFLIDDLEKFESEEKDDPDIKQDPIYGVNLKAYLVEFLKELKRQDTAYFMRLAEKLPQTEKKCLENIFSTQ